MTIDVDSRWFAVIAGEEMGPFSDAELKVLAGRGAIAPTTKVRHYDMAEQQEARAIAGLFGSSSAGAAPPPVTRRLPIARAPALETRIRFDLPSRQSAQTLLSGSSSCRL